jgi:aspartyl-tRNA(Asn)/glutamyl-tRNA(Gln) amidotransferase subunit C
MMAKDEKSVAADGREISDDTLAGVIDLARLDPLWPGMEHQKAHLKRILGHFAVLRQVDIEGVDPTIQINPTPIPLRDDEVVEWLSQEEALSNARLRTGEFFRAPKILGDEEP